MKNLKQLLKWLSGKKSIIGGVIMTTSVYLAGQGQITAETATYINGIVTILFGTASYATGKLVYNK